MLAFFAGLFLPQVSPNLLKADLSNNYYENNYESVEDGILAYHQWVNLTVNLYISLLMDEDFADFGYVELPPSDADCTSGKNVSTYCLAVILNDNLNDFNEYMVAHKNDFSTSYDYSGPNTYTWSAALDAAFMQQNTIENQMQMSEDALDLTLSVYNQIQLIYPVHKEFTDLIMNLEEYRDNLGDLRAIIDSYPSRFNGASTFQCK